MLKALKLAKQIKLKEEERRLLDEQLETLTKRETELERTIEEVETDEDLETVTEEIEALEKQKIALQEQVNALEDDIARLKQEQQEVEEKASGIEEKRAGGTPMTKNKEFELYIRSKGEKRDGLKTTDVGILIPDETLSPLKDNKDVADLRKYVTVKKVTTGSGKMPVLSNDTSNKFATVEELEKNPELNKLKVVEVAYDIKTYRGALPISTETIDDASVDIVGEVNETIKILEVNTSNAAIVEKLKTFPEKNIKNADDLKNIINKELKANGKKMIIASKSFFGEIDLWKDKNGRYILNDNLATETGKIAAGIDIEVLDDEIFGQAGDAVAFIGNPKLAAIYFDRKQLSVGWVDNEIYGTRLMGGTRFDVQKCLDNAGVFATITTAGKSQ